MSVATPVAPAAPPTAAEQRVIDAALRCVARWGIAKTTLDDVAREAGVSRATLYRTFPGGKDALLEAVATSEIARFFGAVVGRLEAAVTLEAALVGAMHEALTRLRAHAALRFLMAHEPEPVVTRIAFSRMDDVLRLVADVAGPSLERWLAPDEAARVAEWLTRLVVSHACNPGPDTGDEDAIRALVRSFVLPGLRTASTTVHGPAAG